MVKGNKYYLAETYEDDLHTASIVRKDNERILEQEGFSPLKFHHTKEGSVIVKIRRLNELAKLALSVKKNDTVVFHFPLLAKAYKVLLDMLQKKSVKTVALIIDIDGLRYNDDKLLQKELEVLQLFTHIIAHNTSMKSFLSQYINKGIISCIELFDYHYAGNVPVRSLSNQVCFAGNFEKAAFANELKKVEGITFNLYGPMFNCNHQENVFYKGSFSASQLPLKLQGSFGLVWDGPSIETCDAYLKFNNPHKLSLYISAGLPVIVWDKSALASFVVEKNIGIAISDLLSLKKIISQITPGEYAEIKSNIDSLAVQVKNGYHLRKVLEGI